MWVVVEFKKKECATVPFNWLVDDQKMCMWPKNAYSEKEVQEMIQSKQEPMPKWRKHPVVKILGILATLEEATISLDAILQENASTSGLSDQQTTTNQLTRKRNISYSDDNESDDETEEEEVQASLPQSSLNDKRKLSQSFTRKRKMLDGCVDDGLVDEGEMFPTKDKMKCSQTIRHARDTLLKEYQDSSSEFSDYEEQVVTKTNTAKNRIFESLTRESTPVSSGCSTPVSIASTTINSLASSSDVASTDMQNSNILETILKNIIYVKTVQEQEMIKLDDIQRCVQTGTVQQLQVPTSLPNTPIQNKQDYKLVEDFLSEESNALYMRRRLAAIGGSSVRNTVMNIMKFLLSNKVAMKFNWSGRDKRPFKETRMMKVITDAVKLSYSGREPSDLTDTDIRNAVKDWLKLAKHRHCYNSKHK